ncbi:MAG: hypothetical protein JSR24_00750 [Proteobacteria bacterium]|nr:hypothetical protein [Pseudomonadota bacterium]
MTGVTEDLGASYPVLVTIRNGEFCLRIKELALVVRSRDIQAGYDQLRARRLELVKWAKIADAIDELPMPRPIPIAPYPLGDARPR